MSIATKLQTILTEIGPDVQLVAVTKYATIDQMRAVIDAGAGMLGESRVQDLIQKKEIFSSPSLKWQFIGHLQTNKIKKAIQSADMIQSVDSLRLLQLINHECEVQQKIMPVLLQVNIANESTKFGFSRDEILCLDPRFLSFAFVKINGIMLLAPHIKDQVVLRAIFRETKQLFDRLKSNHPEMTILSMGMSEDYQLAIEEGSTMIRIGTALYS